MEIENGLKALSRNYAIRRALEHRGREGEGEDGGDHIASKLGEQVWRDGGRGEGMDGGEMTPEWRKDHQTLEVPGQREENGQKGEVGSRSVTPHGSPVLYDSLNEFGSLSPSTTYDLVSL